MLEAARKETARQDPARQDSARREAARHKAAKKETTRQANRYTRLDNIFLNPSLIQSCRKMETWVYYNNIFYSPHPNLLPPDIIK